MENGDQADKMENGIASPVQPAQTTVSQSHSTYEMVKHNATELGRFNDWDNAQRVKFSNSKSIVEGHEHWKVTVPEHVKHCIYGTIVGGAVIVFVAMLAYFLVQTTNVLVSENQTGPCISPSQIYTFPQIDENAYLSPYVTDLASLSPHPKTQYYVTAHFTACKLVACLVVMLVGSLAVHWASLWEDTKAPQ